MTSLEEAMHENTVKTNQTVEPRNDYSSIADLSMLSSPPIQSNQKRFSMSLASLAACQSIDCSDKVVNPDVEDNCNKYAVTDNLPVTGESKTYLSDNVSSDTGTSLRLPSVEGTSQLSNTSHLRDTQRSRMSVEMSSVALPVSGGERIGNRPVSCDRTSEQSPTHSPAISPSPDCSRSPVGPANSPASGSSSLEVKRARVETIVSTMMQCPNGPVNGCKKRKFYQPQQHEAVNEDQKREGDNDDDSKQLTEPPIKERRVFQEDLKSDLRKMQEQLVLIEQQYTELFQEHVSSRVPKTHKKPLQFGERDNPLAVFSGVTSKDTDNIQSSRVKNTTGETGQLAYYKDPEIRQSCIVKPNGQSSQPSMTTDLDSLVDALKSEISRSLANVIDSVVTKYKQTRVCSKSLETETPKDLTLLSQILDRKSPRTKVVDRSNRVTNQMLTGQKVNPFPRDPNSRTQGFYSQGTRHPASLFYPTPLSQAIQFAPSSNIAHHPPLPAGTGVTTSSSVTEQTEAISLVVTPKKRRHKVTDARVTSSLVNCCMSQEDSSPKCPAINDTTQPFICLPVYPHQPPPLVPVSLPTSVAIPNPSLHHHELFPYCYETTRLAYFDQAERSFKSALAGRTPSQYPDSPVESTAFSYLKQDVGEGSDGGESQGCESGLAVTSTLTPMHLRKAKLMFFYVRYPSSTVLKLYFQDIKFNKNNTAQLTKWFSNFREFFYIQMEKFSRQAISEGVKNSENLKVGFDSELVRILNLHYNRNNHIEVPEHFRYVVELALREFFMAISTGKDQEQSWKKTVYKVIARLDTNVPEYFKNPNFMEQLE
ncbi:homeobox protein prospero-like [Tachypleus tridentatus]|uniref:homeobox protein prospero-like n=1 Tax=Tachypleus tridentatus TaxID=6853 RepID=UPI003FD3B0BE